MRELNLKTDGMLKGTAKSVVCYGNGIPEQESPISHLMAPCWSKKCES